MSDTMPKRKNVRLRGHDYSAAGGYFVTLCAFHNRNQFSEIVDNGPDEEPTVLLSPFGAIAEQAIQRVCAQFGIRISPYVIMPNHIHLYIVLYNEKTVNGHYPALRTVVSAIKFFVTSEIHKQFPSYRSPIWQRNYFEHIVRNGNDGQEIRRYIVMNPTRWVFKRRKDAEDDLLNPTVGGTQV